ncbi:MAG TPA: nickel-responsive transcriptional regulator NikR [Planctomycetota bacterium]|nr:nickel-responsive transcriptional regulator NikR [Planctomycetota bacterium]
MSELVRFGVSLEDSLLQDFDRLIDEKGYPSRSEALRDLIRNYLVQADWSKLSGEQVATLTLVYNHEYREITDRLTDMQHDSHSLIVCATHVHLTAHTCLEVIVLRGTAADITKIADKLIATRGVQHGKLTMTTLGRAR